MEGHDLEGVTALLIPHVGIVSGLIFALALIWLTLKFRELSHKERLAAIERGLPLIKIDRKRLQLYGMILFALGFAATIGLWVNFGWSHALWGLLPLASGFVLFLYATFAEEKPEAFPVADSSIPA